MLPDRECELLTAFVDGELDERQHEALLRLLRQSAEARALLNELEANAARLKALPARTLPADFRGEVLQRIKALPHAAVRPLRSAGRMPAWLAPALAAAVLVAVTAVSFWFFRPARQPEMVEVPAREDRLPLIAKIITGTTERFADPALHVEMAELAQEKGQVRLTSELSKQNAVHLEIACKNTGEAIAGLNNALEKSGVKVVVDPAAKIERKNASTVIMVYAENLRPEELSDILGRLAAREKMKDILDRQFASVHVDTLSARYRDQVARRFGMNGSQLQPPPKDFLTKFIRATKDKSKKTGPAVTPAQPADKFALVFASDADDSTTVSPDLQQFLKAHRRQTAGTLQIVLVVRPGRA